MRLEREIIGRILVAFVSHPNVCPSNFFLCSPLRVVCVAFAWVSYVRLDTYRMTHLCDLSSAYQLSHQICITYRSPHLIRLSAYFWLVDQVPCSPRKSITAVRTYRSKHIVPTYYTNLCISWFLLLKHLGFEQHMGDSSAILYPFTLM